MTGDLTNTYVWDADNRLIKINYPGMNNFSSFVFDAHGRNTKIVEVSGGATTSTKQFVWTNQRCEVRDGAGAMVSMYFGAGQTIGGDNYLYTKDSAGSVREMTDSNGVIQARYSFDPFGRTIREFAQSANFEYAGSYVHIPSGLNLMIARAYHSGLGRWLNRDPFEASDTNLYAYVTNSPINLVDPEGAQGITIVGIEEPMSTTATMARPTSTSSGLGRPLNSPKPGIRIPRFGEDLGPRWIVNPNRVRCFHDAYDDHQDCIDAVRRFRCLWRKWASCKNRDRKRISPIPPTVDGKPVRCEKDCDDILEQDLNRCRRMPTWLYTGDGA